MGAQSVIVTDGLVRQFDTLRAVDKLSLDLPSDPRN